MPGRPIFDDVISEMPPHILDLLGGKLYEIGYQDGVLTDRSRDRTIPFRVRYPKRFAGPAAIVLISPGTLGHALGHTWYPHFGTAYSQLGFLAVNIGHLPSADEMQHRYNCPLDVSFTIDALVRVADAAQGIAYETAEALPLSSDFTGIPDAAWLSHDPRTPPPRLQFGAYPDVDHIGVIGHSFGAFTAHAVGGMLVGPTLGIRDFRDPRVDAIVPIAPQGKDRYGCFDKGPAHNSWQDVTIPSYILNGEHDRPDWRRQPFDRYPEQGDKYLTIASEQDHRQIGGEAPADVRRFLDLNTALFFHTYLRGGLARDKIGLLARPDGWTLERKVTPA